MNLTSLFEVRDWLLLCRAHFIGAAIAQSFLQKTASKQMCKQLFYPLYAINEYNKITFMSLYSVYIKNKT